MERRERELAILHQVPLFAQLPRSAQRAVTSPLATRKCFAKGEVIYTEQSFQRSLGVLLTGEARVNKGPLLVSTLQVGDCFGAAALWSDARNYVTTVTAHSECAVLFFPQALMSQLMEEDVAFAQGYIRYLSGRIRFLTRKIEGLVAGSVEGKLEQYLLEREQDGTVVLDCSCTDLAKRLNVGRASVYRGFELLERQGRICRQGKHITIL